MEGSSAETSKKLLRDKLLRKKIISLHKKEIEEQSSISKVKYLMKDGAPNKLRFNIETELSSYTIATRNVTEFIKRRSVSS